MEIIVSCSHPNVQTWRCFTSIKRVSHKFIFSETKTDEIIVEAAKKRATFLHPQQLKLISQIFNSTVQGM